MAYIGGPHRPGVAAWAGRMLQLKVSRELPDSEPVEEMTMSSESQKPVFVSGFGECFLHDLAMLLEWPF